MEVEVVSSLLDLEEDIECFGRRPFASPAFYRLFEQAGVVGPGTGWNPVYFLAKEEGAICGFLPAYVKTDSYGEFIFDWAWADLYQRHGRPYYPKLTSACPFSPVNVPKAMAQNYETKKAMLLSFAKLFSDNPALSSAHALFVEKGEAHILEEQGFFTRKTFQYHFTPPGNSFEDFLQSLKSRKRKQIKKERDTCVSSGLRFEMKTENFDIDFMDNVYELYLNTIDKKMGQAYLNQDFFRLLGKEWESSLAVACAWDDQGLAAMALYLESEDTLYGRYWGAREGLDVPYLHFELSYYQGMEYCYQKGFKLFEAGAQGEQKLLRGFVPTEIFSCHKLAQKPFQEAVEHHIKTENAYMAEQARALAQYLPYKNEKAQEEKS